MHRISRGGIATGRSTRQSYRLLPLASFWEAVADTQLVLRTSGQPSEIHSSSRAAFMRTLLPNLTGRGRNPLSSQAHTVRSPTPSFSATSLTVSNCGIGSLFRSVVPALTGTLVATFTGSSLGSGIQNSGCSPQRDVKRTVGHPASTVSTLPTNSTVGGNLAHTIGFDFVAQYGQLPQLASGLRFFMRGPFRLWALVSKLWVSPGSHAAGKGTHSNSTDLSVSMTTMLGHQRVEEGRGGAPAQKHKFSPSHRARTFCSGRLFGVHPVLRQLGQPSSIHA